MKNAAQQRQDTSSPPAPWFQASFATPENPYSARRPAPVKMLRQPPKPTPLFPLPFRFRKTKNEIVKRRAVKNEVVAPAPASAPPPALKTNNFFAAWIKRNLY